MKAWQSSRLGEQEFEEGVVACLETEFYPLKVVIQSLKASSRSELLSSPLEQDESHANETCAEIHTDCSRVERSMDLCKLAFSMYRHCTSGMVYCIFG